MNSGSKFYKRKKKGRSIEVPLSHAMLATEAHLRALSIINDDEDVDIEFTPTMVRINTNKLPIGERKQAGGSAKQQDG